MGGTNILGPPKLGFLADPESNIRYIDPDEDTSGNKGYLSDPESNIRYIESDNKNSKVPAQQANKKTSPTKSSAPDAKSASRSKRSFVEADRETGQIRRTSRNRSTILSPLKSSSNKSSILGD